MLKYLEIFTIPIMVLNMFSAIVGGIWIAFMGEWKLIGIGIFLMITSHWILTLLMLPGIGLTALIGAFSNPKNIFVYILGYFSNLYLNILISGWCVLSFIICTNFYGAGYQSEISYELLPYLLWSWSMALSPWQYFANYERDNEYTMATTYIVSIFYLLFLVSTFTVNSLPVLTLLIHFSAILVLVIILPIYYMYTAYKIGSTQSEYI